MPKFIKIALIALTTTAAVAVPLVNASPASAGESTTEIYKFMATPETFYPTVRDGFRDGVEFFGRSSGDAAWQIVIRNSSGRKIREFNRYDEYAGEFWWTWDGKDYNRNPVKVGTYTATFTAEDIVTGERDTRTRTLHAVTGTVDKQFTKVKDGIKTSGRKVSTSCKTYPAPPDWRGESLVLDCWGGSYAMARYGWNLPSGARNVTWHVAGESGCCSPGTVQQTGWRTGDHFDVKVQVTGYRMFTVHKASVTYTIKVPR